MATDPSLQPDPEPHPKSPPSNRPDLVPETSPISPSSKGKAPMEEPSAAADLGDAGDGDPYSQASCCGICLSEEGHAVRGHIDSCDHYFCFLCIIEWSKIESRCPLCKGRFGNIRRMRADGSFIGDRAVVVPVRDQIYDHERNTTSGPVDPYSNISCNICASSSDENLMLLCDLCDTAVHTYCSGLGANVPEDDWFCQECAQMKAEELNSDSVTNMGSSPSSDRNTEKPHVPASTSIFDIVRGPKEPGDPEVERLLTLFSPQQHRSLSSASAPPHQAPQNVAAASRRRSSTGVKSEKKSSVRTLNRCRDVNKYIRDLRENWNALRSGSMSFASTQMNSRATNNSRAGGSKSNGSVYEDTSDKSVYDVDRAWKMFDVANSKLPQKLGSATPSTSRSLSLKESSSSKDSKSLFLGASSKSVPSKTKSNTLSGFKKSSGTTPSTSRSLSLKVSSSKDSKNLFLDASSKSVPSKTKSGIFSGLQMHQSVKQLSLETPFTARVLSLELSSSKDSKNLFLGASSKSVPSKTKSSTFGGLNVHQSSKQLSVATPLTASVLSLEVSSSKDSKNSFIGASSKSAPSKTKSNTFSGLELHQSVSKRSGQQNNCITLGREKSSFSYTGLEASATPENTRKQETVKLSSQEKRGQASLPANHERILFSCTESLAESLTGASGASSTNLQKKTASGRNIVSDTKSSRKRGNAENIGCERKRLKVDDEAKSEIQSLVKLNLKLLTAGKKLEVDMFKDIARRSTHEILAACGLESRIHNRKPIIPKPNCSHEDQIKQPSKLALMSSSCRECFYTFVKDVVSSVLSQRFPS